jgi:hypothetical protein
MAIDVPGVGVAIEAGDAVGVSGAWKARAGTVWDANGVIVAASEVIALPSRLPQPASSRPAVRNRRHQVCALFFIASLRSHPYHRE